MVLPSKSLVPAALLLAFGHTLFAGKEFLPGPHDQVVAGQLLIGLLPGADINQILGVAAPQAAATRVGRLGNTYLLRLPEGIQAMASKALAAHPLVRYVEPNHVRTTAVTPPNDPYMVQQWALTTLQAAQAWSYFPDHYLTAATAAGNRVKVAIIDTGADCTHPDFMNAGATSTDAAKGGQILWSASYAFVPTTIASPACSWQDDNGHGTHTAGIVAAATDNATGVAALGYPLQLIVYKAMNQNGTGSDYYIADAIQDAIDAGAQVISMSLDGPGYSQTLQSAIDTAWENNVLVVCAAGNNAGTELTYPGDANFALGVAATDSNNAVAGWSNYGNWVKIAAPGVNILSTYPGGQYETLSGTSMAAPHVAALAGLLFAANPGISVAAVAQRIQQTAQSPNPGWNQNIGYGVIDAGAALAGLAGPFTQGSLTGQVTDQNGNPMNNATVTAGNQTFVTAEDPTTQYADGLFRINLSPGTYTIKASQPFYSQVTLQATVVAGADTMMNIQLGVQYGEFTGTVSYNGVAVEGAIVEAISGGTIQATAVTNASGAYTLYMPAGTYSLTASAPGYLNSSAASQPVSANSTVTVNLPLAQLGTIAGTVTDLNGVPVSGAHIDFTNVNFTAGAQTGSAGTYATFGIPAGTYTVTASASGYSSVSIAGVSVTNNVSTLVNLQFSTGVSLTNGLLGYWPLNEGSGSVAYDQSGNGYNAGLTNTEWISGPSSDAVNFNGSTSQAVTPAIPFGGAFSVSVWVNAASTRQSAWAGLVQSQSGSGFYLGADATGSKYKFVVNSGEGSSGSCAYVSVTEGCAQGGTVAAGWHLVIGTYDGTTAILYIDGAMVAADTFTAPANITVPVEIGASWNTAAVWNGALEGLRLYDRALSASEVASLFSAPTLAAQTITFAALPNVVFGSAMPALSATATSGLPVSFASTTPGICSLAQFFTTGTCTIQATQAGNANWAAATPVSQSFSVTTASQTITFGPLANVAFGSAMPALSATATSGLPVSFASMTPGICSLTQFFTTGTCTIQATQAGNANWAAATPVSQSFSVTSATGTAGVNSLNFPNTVAGSASPVQSFTFQNSGNSPLTIASISLAGSDAANYRDTADAARPCPVASATLAAGASCILDVTFVPMSQGAHNNAWIAIMDNSGNVAGTVQSVGLTGTGIVLASISVAANSSSLPSGASEAFSATGTFSDNSSAPLTTQVTWASSAQNVASVTGNGMATALAAGQTNISASMSGVTSNNFQLTVAAGSAASITAVGGSGQSTASGTTFASALQAVLKDSGGNPVPNVPVTFTAPAKGASGTFANGLTAFTTATNSSGIATSLSFTANAMAGAYSVSASASGVANLASFALTNFEAAVLTITETPNGTFIQGQDATYTITVANAANAGPTSGPITVTESVPPGLTLTGLSGGPMWTCNLASASCTTSNVLNPGAVSTITVTLSVPYNGPTSAANSVNIVGGGASAANAGDPTPILSACSVTLGASTTVADVQKMVNEALGVSPAVNDLNGDGRIDIVDLQIVTVATMGQGCSAS